MKRGVGEREGTRSNRTSASTSTETYQKCKNSRNTILLLLILYSLHDNVINTGVLKTLHKI